MPRCPSPPRRPTGPRRVHRLDHEEEQSEGHGQEDEQRVEEVTVEEHGAVDPEREAAEVGTAEDRRHQRREQVLDQSLDHRAEGGADDDADRQVDDVAAQKELFELG